MNGDQSAEVLLIRYRHLDCPVTPGVEWFELYESACDSKCPGCGHAIEASAWVPAREAFAFVAAGECPG